MTNEELLAIRNLLREELTSVESKIERVESAQAAMQVGMTAMQADMTENFERVDERIKDVHTETMKGAAILHEAQFSKQFNLLDEKIEEVLRKMPSEDDMDIIDETLQEHGGELRILRQDVNELKKAL